MENVHSPSLCIILCGFSIRIYIFAQNNIMSFQIIYTDSSLKSITYLHIINLKDPNPFKRTFPFRFRTSSFAHMLVCTPCAVPACVYVKMSFQNKSAHLIYRFLANCTSVMLIFSADLCIYMHNIYSMYITRSYT